MTTTHESHTTPRYIYSEEYARDRSKGTRKAMRMNIRHALGTSREAAPTINNALLAVSHLKKLVDASSNGRFGLAVKDFRTDEFITVAQAAQIVDDAQRSGKGWL